MVCNREIGVRWGAIFGIRLTCWALLVTSTCYAGSSRHEVVIYLANETAPVEAEQQNYLTIIGWLNSEPSPKTERIVANLNLDREQFSAAVGHALETDEHLEPGTTEFIHPLETLLGELCRSGFIIEAVTEPPRGDAWAAPGSLAHRACYLSPYLKVKARRC